VKNLPDYEVSTIISIFLIVLGFVILIQRIRKSMKPKPKKAVPTIVSEPVVIRTSARALVFTAFLVDFFIGLFAWLWIIGSIP